MLSNFSKFTKLISDWAGIKKKKKIHGYDVKEPAF